MQQKIKTLANVIPEMYCGLINLPFEFVHFVELGVSFALDESPRLYMLHLLGRDRQQQRQPMQLNKWWTSFWPKDGREKEKTTTLNFTVQKCKINDTLTTQTHFSSTVCYIDYIISKTIFFLQIHHLILFITYFIFMNAVTLTHRFVHTNIFRNQRWLCVYFVGFFYHTFDAISWNTRKYYWPFANVRACLFSPHVNEQVVLRTKVPEYLVTAIKWRQMHH